MSGSGGSAGLDGLVAKADSIDQPLLRGIGIGTVGRKSIFRLGEELGHQDALVDFDVILLSGNGNGARVREGGTTRHSFTDQTTRREGRVRGRPSM